METRRSSSKLTYDDYVRLPDDGLRHEIIDGEHYATPSPVTRHQRISGPLSYLLQAFLERHPLGELFVAPFDVVLSPFDVVVPDLIYLSRERAAQLLTSKNLPGPPDLVEEILSPGTRSRDERLKRDLYARAGVREYWLVDPERDVVRVYRAEAGGFGGPRELSKARGVLTTELLPGLEIPLERLLA